MSKRSVNKAAKAAAKNFSSPVKSKKSSQPALAQKSPAEQQPEVLAAGLWLRAVLGFEAPFGFDRMPTVWD